MYAAGAWAQRPVAELPRVYLDTTWKEPQGGKTWHAHTAAELSDVLVKCAPGDVIALDAGATYTGNFAVPAKTDTSGKWIYIISSKLANLPVGQRVSKDDAGNMPKIVSPSASSAITFKDGASHWRFAGIEVSSASTYKPPNYTPDVFYAYSLISDSTNPSITLPDSITFDRCYIHGDDTHDVQSGMQGNISNFAVVDSYISDIHMKGADTQAVVAYYTPGPIKIVNNYLSAAGENVMLGGAGGYKNPYVPSDVEIRNNYIFKPLSWAKIGVGIPPNPSMTAKNAFEMKSAQRVLFDKNVIENVWAGSQVGVAILLTVRSSQSGDVAVVNDITITNNVLKNVVAGFATLAADDMCGSASYPNCHNPGSQGRWYIANNLILFFDPTLPGGGRSAALFIGSGRDRINDRIVGLHDLVFQHNTTVAAASKPCWGSVFVTVASGQKPPFSSITKNIWILDNVFCRQPTGDWGQQGTAGLQQYIGESDTEPHDLNKRFYGNVMYVPPGDRAASFPPHNLSTTKAFTYVDPSKGNYELLQPKWMETSDGKSAGINFAALPQ